MSRIGVFGGSFHPPHVGHLAAARFFADSLALDHVWILPAGEPPLKAALQGATPADRLRLCERTFDADSRFALSDLELRRPGRSYTADTLRAIQAQHPGDALHLLIGTDQLERFTQWKDWRGILRLCTLCVLPRDAQPLSLPPELPPERVRLLTGFVPIQISATELRGKLAAGEDVSPWLTPAALQYIEEKGLYGANTNP
jgi:nicotinate-nucleotide adenylyltransferase